MESFGFLVVFLLLFAVGAFVLWMHYEEGNRRLAHAAERQKNSIEGLRKERELARLRNDIAYIKEQSELRPLILETKKAILQGKADKRLLDAVFARRALDDVLGAGGATPEPDPLERARIKLLTEIENRKADGQDTADLEAALRALRSVNGSAA
jgi:hypothetical protein